MESKPDHRFRNWLLSQLYYSVYSLGKPGFKGVEDVILFNL